MDNRESKIWLVGISLVIALCTTGNAAIVRFHETATIENAVVTLGDIADVTDVDPTLTKKLQETVLGPAPAPGTEKHFRFIDMRARLRAVGINLADLEFSGHSVVRVQTPKVTQAAVVLEPITRIQQTAASRAPSPREIEQAETRLIQAVRETIHHRWPELQLDTVNVSIVPSSVSLADSHALHTFMRQESIQLTGWQGPVDTPQVLTETTTDSQGEPVRLTIQCQIQIQPFVLTVAESVPRGHILQASDLKWVQSLSHEQAITVPENIVGRQTKRAIRHGEAIETKDLERVLLVRSRDIVTVTVRSGGISVRREMKSLSDGGLDDPITVMSLTGQDRLTARVTGVHTAEIPSPTSSVSISREPAGVSR